MQDTHRHVSASPEKSFPGLIIFDSFPVASIFFDLRTGAIVSVNGAAKNLTGYDAASFQSIAAFTDAMIPNVETRELFKKLLFLPLHAGEVQRTPVTCLSRQGRLFIAEMQLWQTSGDDYPANVRGLHLLELSSDDPVVERLRKDSVELNTRILVNENELERHRQWLDVAMESHKDGGWTIDFTADRMNFVHTNLLSVLGYNPEDIENTQLSWDNLTHPDDLPQVRRLLQAHFDGETPFYEAEYRVKAKNGDWRWILGHGKVVRRDEEGRPLEAVGIHMDIDRLKRTEENLRKSEAQFRTLVENAPVALILVSPDGRFLYANQRFSELSGHEYTEFESIENWWAAAYPDAEAHAEFLNKLRDGSPFQTEIIGRGGLEKQVIVHFTRLSDGAGFIAYEDITSQVIYERTLLKREKELYEKSEKLEDMNAALRVLLNRMNSDKDELESKIHMNIRDLVMPYVDKLESLPHNEAQQSYLNIIRQNLQNIASSFAVQFSRQNVNLTPREIQIANMINEDMANKDIAAILYISESSVEFHRHNIRKKLGLVDKKVNLKTYLRGIL